MSTPVIELIALDIVARIGEITIVNLFNQDLTAIRSRREDWVDESPGDGKVLVWQEDEDRAPDEEQSHNTTEWDQTFSLIANVIDSDSATTSIDIRLNQVKSDIRKKMREDPSRGGNAIDTKMGTSRKVSEGNLTGIEVEIMVRYRTQQNDPYVRA